MSVWQLLELSLRQLNPCLLHPSLIAIVHIVETCLQVLWPQGVLQFGKLLDPPILVKTNIEGALTELPCEVDPHVHSKSAMLNVPRLQPLLGKYLLLFAFYHIYELYEEVFFLEEQELLPS